VCVGGRTRSGGRSAVAGFEHLATGGCEEKKRKPAATGGRTARVADSFVDSRIVRIQIFRFSDFQYFLSTPASACTMQRPPSLSDFDAARLDSGVQTAPAGTDVKVFRQQASKQAGRQARGKQASKKARQATNNLICMRDSASAFYGPTRCAHRFDGTTVQYCTILPFTSRPSHYTCNPTQITTERATPKSGRPAEISGEGRAEQGGATAPSPSCLPSPVPSAAAAALVKCTV
jgi:hypothetical protein